MSDRSENYLSDDRPEPSLYLAMITLAVLLALGIWLFLNNNSFRDDAILTPLTSPANQSEAVNVRQTAPTPVGE